MSPHTARLPGIQPADPDSWINADEAFSGQMAERDRLIDAHEAEVHCLLPPARDAAVEVLGLATSLLKHREGYRVGREHVLRPDGVEVRVDASQPLLTLGRLVQEDICVLTPGPEGHVLTGAILCFPASWTLSEKIGRPLLAIHQPVAAYSAEIANRVQRLFDALRPERPLWRSNAMLYEDAALFQPRREDDPRGAPTGSAQFLRSERQTLLKLPRTGACVFAIHSVVVHRRALSPEQQEGLEVLEKVSAP